MIDDITLQVHLILGPSKLDHLFFEPGRNDIVIQFGGTVNSKRHSQFLHDIELLDEAGLEYLINQEL